MTLEVDLDKRLGDFHLAARFSGRGRLTVLFGPSGSGKTTLVNLVAGSLRPETGYVSVDGEPLVDTARGFFVPRHRRRIGYVFQDARLFPHLSVRQNLHYGRWFKPRAERYGSAADVVELLGIGHLLHRRPAGLSGGERQRVAIGRALLTSPRLLLMDEPLAALDDARKAELLPYIERLRDELRVPILYVSHSVPEVLRLASHLVVLDGGRVVAEGPAAETMRRLDLVPLTADAEPGQALDTVVEAHEDAYGLTRLASRAGAFRVPRLEAPVGAPLRIRVRARDVMLATQRPHGISALNVLSGKVAEIRLGDVAHADVLLDCGGDRILARVTRLSVDELRLTPGQAVHAVVKAVSFERSAGR